MRVVVHHPARTEPGEVRQAYHRDPETGVTSVTTETVKEAVEVPESKSAYRLGRIEDFTNPLTGETTPREEVAAQLVEAAKREFPGLEVAIEHLHVAERHPETNEAIRHEWKDHPPEQPVAAGAEHTQELATDQSQEAAS